MTKFIALTVLDPESDEKAEGILNVDKMLGCIADGDITIVNMEGEAVLVEESLEEVQSRIHRAQNTHLLQ
jgi:uncharacterized protein YlzI (FlbEa/FlbD family)